MFRYYLLKVIRLSIAFSLISANTSNAADTYIGHGVLTAASQISTKKILDYENIASIIQDDFDRSRFYSIMSIEIQRRIKELDNKFEQKKIFYIDKINMFEEDLNLPRYVKNLPEADMSKLPILENKLIFSNSYSLNKKNVEEVSKVYRKKLIIYRKVLKNYRNYFIALDKLYYCISAPDFQDNIITYNQVIQHLFN